MCSVAVIWIISYVALIMKQKGGEVGDDMKPFLYVNIRCNTYVAVLAPGRER